ncbi:hypothetical protein ES288_D10G113500v1 [Gossypium darwinii]|uniref:Uncharacterized protein n=1 Tax=Gossypium darwinii TaxID=34276 RepID=A0A5D2AZ18_GOSDA|nr:hypothetical protein ES288_D10G113500v1 [Gossypium darwinii]
MDKLLRPYDKEFVRMAMLKHEETFKQQVYELRRLYRIQKTLMKSFENSRTNGSFSLKNQTSRRRLDLEHSVHHHNDETSEVIDESEIELTLGLPMKERQGTTLPRTWDFGPCFSSSSSESCHVTMGYRHGSKSTNDLEEQLRKEGSDQPPWILQVLTMNMSL